MAGFEDPNAAVRWTAAQRRLDGTDTLHFAQGEVQRIMSLALWISQAMTAT